MARFNEFEELAGKLHVVSLADVRKFIPGLRQETLYRWHKTGKIVIIAPGYYSLSGALKSETDLFVAANRIYSPSFISLHTALEFYGLIPETVLTITSVSTRKTRNINSSSGRFLYRSVKPEFYFGYKVVSQGGSTFLIAEPERALVDLLYLRKDLSDAGELAELRIDRDNFRKLDTDKLQEMAAGFSRDPKTAISALAGGGA